MATNTNSFFSRKKKTSENGDESSVTKKRISLRNPVVVTEEIVIQNKKENNTATNMTPTISHPLEEKETETQIPTSPPPPSPHLQALFDNNNEDNPNDNNHKIVQLVRIVGLFIIVFILAVALIINFSPSFNETQDSNEIEQISQIEQYYPIVQFMSAGKCMVLMPEQIVEGGMHHIAQLNKIRDSMNYYMENRTYDGICAIDIGYPICYCMLRQKKSKQVIGLYNFNITSMSNSLRNNQESSHFCPDQSFQFVPRATTIVVEYLVEDGGYMQREFYQEDSFALQNMWELNHGITVCERNNKLNEIEQNYRLHISSAVDPGTNFKSRKQSSVSEKTIYIEN